MTEGLQTLDERGLVLRKYFGLEMPDTCLFRDMTGHSSAVARQHINVDPGGLQFAHGLYGAILDAVGDRRDSQGLLESANQTMLLASADNRCASIFNSLPTTIPCSSSSRRLPAK